MYLTEASFDLIQINHRVVDYRSTTCTGSDKSTNRVKLICPNQNPQ